MNPALTLMKYRQAAQEQAPDPPRYGEGQGCQAQAREINNTRCRKERGDVACRIRNDLAGWRAWTKSMVLGILGTVCECHTGNFSCYCSGMHEGNQHCWLERCPRRTLTCCAGCEKTLWFQDEPSVLTLIYTSMNSMVFWGLPNKSKFKITLCPVIKC